MVEIHQSRGRDALMALFLLQWQIQISLVVVPRWWWNDGSGIVGWKHKDGFCICVEVRKRVAMDGSRRRVEEEI